MSSEAKPYEASDIPPLEGGIFDIIADVERLAATVAERDELRAIGEERQRYFTALHDSLRAQRDAAAAREAEQLVRADHAVAHALDMEEEAISANRRAASVVAQRDAAVEAFEEFVESARYFDMEFSDDDARVEAEEALAKAQAALLRAKGEKP